MQTTQRRLEIYIRLLDGQILNKQELSDGYDISPRAIQRDISQINSGFSDLNLPYSIRYEKKSNGYHLQSDQHVLNHQEVFVLIKVLLASRALNTDELQSTVNGLLNLINSNSRNKVTPLIKNELFNYRPLQHNQSLLNKIWSLSNLILQKKSIQITYQKQHSETVVRDILPQAIIFSEYYFYLVSYNPQYDSNLLYRVDRIKDYTVTGNIKLDYKDRFEEGKFRQRIQFMYPGKPTHIKFQFWGIVEAALDRIPTAEVVARYDINGNPEQLTAENRTHQSSKGGSVVIEGDVFGTFGIKMWLLSQGKTVKVLEPSDLVSDIKKEALSILSRYE